MGNGEGILSQARQGGLPRQALRTRSDSVKIPLQAARLWLLSVLSPLPVVVGNCAAVPSVASCETLSSAAPSLRPSSLYVSENLPPPSAFLPPSLRQ